MKEELKKRTKVYLNQPKNYKISGCECGNQETQWSEYEEHLWCDKCQIDFKPKDKGIFSGPIGIGSSRLLGIYFHRLNLETNKVEAFTSEGYYVEAFNFDNDFDFNEKKEIILIQDENKLFGNIDLNTFEIKLNEMNIENDNRFGLIIYTISHEKEIKEWKFEVKYINKEFQIKEVQEFDIFKKFVLNQKLRKNFSELTKTKPSKI